MVKRMGIAIAVLALLLVTVAPATTADTGGTNRPFTGSAVGFASFGYRDGEGTDGLSNVLDCNEELPPEFDFFKVTTFTSGDGTASHLGSFHFEAVHCPGLERPTQGQVAFVAANGDVLYGEYEGVYEEDGVYTYTTFMSESSTGACYLLHGVPCRSTGRFAGATGTATSVADAYPGDENDPFVPWPWWGNWTGLLSY